MDLNMEAVVDQLLMICPQHARFTIENAVERYREMNFSEAELFQVCLDDLVDLPNLIDIDSETYGLAEGKHKIRGIYKEGTLKAS